MRFWPRGQTKRALIMVATILVFVTILLLVFVDEWSDSRTLQLWADIFQSAITAVAIIVGGIFALSKLQAFRDFEPHLTITHRISHRLIGSSYIHIEVVAILHNSSRVKVEIRDGIFLLQKISPVSDKQVETLYVQAFEGEEYEEVQWPTLFEVSRNWKRGELVIEPSESHPEPFEFIVAKEVKSVMIYTYFHNLKFSEGDETGQGWVATTVYDLSESFDIST